MDAIVTISGGGIIGNYISSRLNNLNIKCVVVEKNQEVFSSESNIRTLTLNPISKKLLDDIGIEVPSAAIKEISVFDAEGTGQMFLMLLRLIMIIFHTLYSLTIF